MKKSIIVVYTVLGACSTDLIYLKNKSTSEIVTCGGRFVGMDKGFKMEGLALQESQCINDYKEQGFIRIPNP